MSCVVKRIHKPELILRLRLLLGMDVKTLSFIKTKIYFVYNGAVGESSEIVQTDMDV